ncbi:MAG: hypothetical protein JWP75_2224 [Frondihabitans sp.]|nr:hypothetical protein [Frondihabitans sp.]
MSPIAPLSRRDVMKGALAAGFTIAAGSVLATCAGGAAQAATPTRTALGITTRSTMPMSRRDFWSAPSAASVREIGSVVPTTTSSEVPGLPTSVPGLGIPLGGIGAGSFMVNQSGTFGPWFFGGSQDDSWELRALSQAAFHVREQQGEETPTVKTLAAKGPEVSGSSASVWDSPLSAWNTLEPGDGSYAALYPFGWTTYRPFETDISMRFFSPIVAGEDRRSSLPVAYFDVRLVNHTAQKRHLSVMFTMPNVAAHVGRQPETVRGGLTSSASANARTGLQAVTLSSDSPTNTPDAVNSEWTIAVAPQHGQHVTFASSWNASGDGSDIYSPFSATGQLANNQLDDSHSAGALCVDVDLEPGAGSTISFALSWDFPQVAFADNNTVWMRRYTNFYGAQEDLQNNYIPGSYPFHRSLQIASDALTAHDENLGAVHAWWKPIALDATYPLPLRTGALNQLAQIPFNTALWEGGLVSNTVSPTSGTRLGTTVPGTHLYLSVDSNAGGGANGGQGTEVGTYSYRAYTQMFPSIERDRLVAKMEAVAVDPSGDPVDPGLTSSTSAADYSANGDPFVTWTQGAQPAPGTVWFIDRPSESLFRMYDYARTHGDEAFLSRAYPAMKKLLAYVQATIPAGTYLPEAPSLLNPSPDLKSPLPYANVFDVIPVNKVDAYTSQLYLLALETMIATASWLGDKTTYGRSLRTVLDQTRAAYESTFWNATRKYYRYTPGPSANDDSVLLSTFFAQHLAERAGLPDLVNVQRYRAHLKTQAALFRSQKDAAGKLIGYPNMIPTPGTTSFPYSGPFGLIYETGVWPTVNYFTGATYVRASARFRDRSLAAYGLSLGSSVATQIWQTPALGYEFNAPLQWEQADATKFIYPAFQSNLASWELLDAVKPTGLPRRI